MEYITACAEQRGEREASLLLEQYLCRSVPVCFACLCNGALTVRLDGESYLQREKAGKAEKAAARYITGRLRLWCRGFPWQKAVKRPEKWLKRAEGELKNLMCRSMEEVRSGLPGQETGLRWGILLAVGREVFAMSGGQEFSLLRLSLGKGTVTRLEGNFRGCLEPGAGILLATEGLSGEASFLSGIRTEEQAGKRLRELLKRTGESESGMAAVLLAAKEEGDE